MFNKQEEMKLLLYVIIGIIYLLFLKLVNLGIIPKKVDRVVDILITLSFPYIVYEARNHKYIKKHYNLYFILTILATGYVLYLNYYSKQYENFENYAKVEFENEKQKKVTPPPIFPTDGVRVNFFVSKIASLLI
jgi:hypothetical protein